MSAYVPNEVDVELETLIRARYPLIYVVSWEERRVEETLREICQKRNKKMLLWSFTTGMAGNLASKDPLAALDFVMNAPDQSVFVLKDFHPFISDVAVTRRLRDLVYTLKTSYKTLILLSPLLKLPPELEKEITVVDYQLPTVGDIDRLLEGIIQSVKANPQIKADLTKQEREQVLQAAAGLTSNEAENVFAKSLVEKRGFDVDVILSEKEQIIRKSGILEYYRASDAFADVGGMDILKQWMERRTVSFGEQARSYGLPEPKGILLLGVQGCGKSLTAKAIASLWRLPLLRLDVGKVFAGVVGASEENMRKAISVAESVAPCVAGDTRITLADGSERTIQELYDGDTDRLDVLGMTDDFRTVPVRVKAVTRRAAPDLYTVRLRHSTLQATGNHLHPVLRDGERTWVRTDALQKGDHVAVPRALPNAQPAPAVLDLLPGETRLYAPGALAYSRPEAVTPQRRHAARARNAEYVKVSELADRGQTPPRQNVTKFAIGRGGTTDSVLPRVPEIVSDELGYLLGLLESDGYIGKRHTIGFVNTNAALHKRFSHTLCQLFGLQTVTRLNDTAGKNSALSGTGENGVWKPCFTSKVTNRLLAHLLTDLRVRLLTLPTSFLNAFLRGVFDGDGCVSDSQTGAVPRVILTAKKPEANQLLRSVLLRAGFQTSNAGHCNIEITGWRNVERFIHQIGSHHPCRRERMEAWLDAALPTQPKDRGDTVPVGALLRRARRAVGMGSHQFASASSGLIHRYEHNTGHPNRERLAGLVAEMRECVTAHGGAISTEVETLARLAAAPIAWSPVLSVTPAPTPEFVYDLACDGVHNFIANNVFTHNCVLWIDELEKGFAGTQSSAFSDGGTTSRVFGSFITWLQEKKAACFVIATSNDVSQLPPELMRKGRFDEIFFVDLPAYPERREIFEIHLKKRKREPSEFDLDRLARETVGYSGAEIEQAVVAALFVSFNDSMRPLATDDLLKTIKESVPLSVTMREGIARLREWAETRARPASSEQAEPTEELAALDPLEARNSLYGREEEASSYDMDSALADGEAQAAALNARLAALEAKTATGLSNVMHETQNSGMTPPAPRLPVVASQGTEGNIAPGTGITAPAPGEAPPAPNNGGAVGASSSTASDGATNASADAGTPSSSEAPPLLGAGGVSPAETAPWAQDEKPS